MPETIPRHRPIFEVAQDALSESRKLSMAARYRFRELEVVDQVTNEETYAALAAARRLAGSWRSALAGRIKAEIDTILSHYRVARWDREASRRPAPSDEARS